MFGNPGPVSHKAFRKLAVGLAGFLEDNVIIFEQLDGDPACRVTAGKEIFSRDAFFHFLQHGIEIRSIGNMKRFMPRLASKAQGFAERFLEAGTLSGHGGDYGDVQSGGKQGGVHMDAGLSGFVHHVAGENHGHAHFHDLHGQEQTALKSRGVHDINDGQRAFRIRNGSEDGPGNDFFLRIRGEGIGAGKVDEHHVFAVEGNGSFLFVHCDAGVVAHMLVGSGVFIEGSGLAAVGIACKGDADGPRVEGMLLAGGLFLGISVRGLVHAFTSTVM